MLWVLRKNISQTCCVHMKSGPKPEVCKWTILPARSLTLSRKCPDSPFASRDFAELCCFFRFAPLWLSIYCQVFSLHLYVQSTKLKMQKLITSETSLCGWAQPVSCEDQQTLVYFTDMGRQICWAWPEKLGGCPPQTAWSTCWRHNVFSDAYIVLVVYLQLQHNLSQGREERMCSM